MELEEQVGRMHNIADRILHLQTVTERIKTSLTGDAEGPAEKKGVDEADGGLLGRMKANNDRMEINLSLIEKTLEQIEIAVHSRDF